LQGPSDPTWTPFAISLQASAHLRRLREVREKTSVQDEAPKIRIFVNGVETPVTVMSFSLAASAQHGAQRRFSRVHLRFDARPSLNQSCFRKVFNEHQYAAVANIRSIVLALSQVTSQLLYRIAGGQSCAVQKRSVLSYFSALCKARMHDPRPSQT